MCVRRSVGFGPVTVEGSAGMSITHTVLLSVSYKENRVEGGGGGGVTSSEI